MFVPRGVSLCALKNELLPIDSDVRDQRGLNSWAMRVELTIDVQPVEFSFDRHRLLRLGRGELGFDGLDQARADGVEWGRKVLSVHLPGFTVRLVVHVLVSLTKCSGLARRDELIQLFRGWSCEVDKPWKSKITVWSQEAS